MGVAPPPLWDALRTLSVMVGGEAAGAEAARPVLEAVGRTIVHVGPSGAGQTVKAANQLIAAGNIQLVAEAIVLLEARESTPRPPPARSAAAWQAAPCSNGRRPT